MTGLENELKSALMASDCCYDGYWSENYAPSESEAAAIIAAILPVVDEYARRVAVREWFQGAAARSMGQYGVVIKNPHLLPGEDPSPYQGVVVQ